jgi:hypothetical protein
MKRFNLIALTATLLSMPALEAFSQQDTTKAQSADSLLTRTLITTPDLTPRSAESLGVFTISAENPRVAHAYAGTHIFNTLRGVAPSLSISSSFNRADGIGLRNNSSAIIMDGIAYSGDLDDYYNLNSFEFGRVTALTNANHNFSYGAAGLFGGFLIRSKTGENHTRPTFEFNSYTSRNFAYKDPVYYEPQHSTWTFSKSLAYSQDFGAVDVRASYNFSSNPFSPDDVADGHDRAHSFKLNTGLNLRKFTARFTGDFRKQDWESRMTGETPGGISSESRREPGLLQGNLFLQYQITNWLKVTSQHLVSSASVDQKLSSYGYIPGTSDSDQLRRLDNAILSIDEALSEKISVRAFVGIQADNVKTTRQSGNGTSFIETETKINNTSLFGGIGAGLMNLLFVDANFRKENFDSFADTRPANLWSTSGSFIFSRLFTDDSHFIGKIRASMARNDDSFHMRFPMEGAFTLEQSEPPTSARRNFEAGADIGFMNNRISLSTSYYKNREDIWAYLLLPYGEAGYYYFGDLYFKGYELSLGLVPIQTSRVQLNSRLIFNKNRTELDGRGLASGGDGTSNIGSTTPDWQGSILNQFSYGGFFVNILLDIRKGGNLYLFDHFGEAVGDVDGSHTKFRDITLAYSFQPHILSRMQIQALQVSLSGRNLIQFNDKDEDAERFSHMSHLKNVALSLSITF